MFYIILCKFLCPNKYSNTTINYGLKTTTKSLISDAKYYLGGTTYNDGYGTADTIYLWEKGTEVFSYEKYCSLSWNSSDSKCASNYCENNPTDGFCNVTRSTSWVGEVVLMYPSDEYLVYTNGVDEACYNNLYKLGL